MRKCKTCLHFSKLIEKNKEDNKTDYLNAKVGECRMALYIDTFESIKRIEDEDKLISASEWGDDTLALVGINFGCIHHKRKESTYNPKNSASVLLGS